MDYIYKHPLQILLHVVMITMIIMIFLMSLFCFSEPYMQCVICVDGALSLQYRQSVCALIIFT